MAKSRSKLKSEPSLVPAALGCLTLQVLFVSLFFLFVSENQIVVGAFFSHELWARLAATLGASFQRTPDGSVLTSFPIGLLGFYSLILCSIANCAPVIGLALLKRKPQFLEFTAAKTIANTWWTWPLIVWSVFWILNLLLPEMPLSLWLIRTVPLALAATLSGWLWEAVREWIPAGNEISAPVAEQGTGTTTVTPTTNCKRSRARWIVAGVAAIFVVVSLGMNFSLWHNLQIPHGDSSMYEEHLWNTLHGKGFRSYLDQGLFLGEHVQVIHLLLLPLYVLWPSHLFMETCGSLALAIGAIPVFLIARRHSSSERTAAILAIAYLLYFPLQFLDIAIDLKTFRPSAFGIPAMLFAINAMEVRRWGIMTFCFLLALSSQEDFAVVIAPLGLWLAIESGLQYRKSPSPLRRREIIIGLVTCVLATIYVIFVVKVVLPWFRSGSEIHYVSYFQKFGKSAFEVVINLIIRPDLVWKYLITASTLALFLHLLQPAGMPLRAWRRLLVGLPLFALLAANELTWEFPGPFHHFHAPMIPIIIWAMCASVGIAIPKNNVNKQVTTQSPTNELIHQRGLWILCSAFVTGIFFSLSPLGIKFWDSGSPFYWKSLYVQSERAKQFEKVLPLIPTTARVASTDFIHPRFTHYERSYDYSHYLRKVADYEDKVPDDTDYIVIDTRHRYSDIHSFEETREFRNQRDQWEVVPVDTNGYFIVLKRIKCPPAEETSGAQNDQ
ncbi:DUF2079 domain-containing protein [Planctomicrobium sp. SH527]|uniref:DUF2079 domain-containing protein n=1 Tax=Planctomicrobium sp. SH527 TaxID=3448123 RepID=UPI003F5BD50A